MGVNRRIEILKSRQWIVVTYPSKDIEPRDQAAFAIAPAIKKGV
jgi:hypothetical protein